MQISLSVSHAKILPLGEKQHNTYTDNKRFCLSTLKSTEMLIRDILHC